MIAAFFKVNVRPGKKEELVEFFKWDGTVAGDEEPGTLRFDVFQDPENENTLFLYEAYVDDAALEAHKANAPFQKFINGLRDDCIESFEPVIPGWTEAIWPPPA